MKWIDEEKGMEVVKFGNSSLTLKCQVRNKLTRKTILAIDRMVLVSLSEAGTPIAHGKTAVSYVKDRFPEE